MLPFAMGPARNCILPRPNLRDGVVEAISCPMLVCEAEDDLFFKGQPQQLYDHLTAPGR
jgi:hypothetical protein